LRRAIRRPRYHFTVSAEATALCAVVAESGT
jgi:hypothetical protein